LRYATGRDSLVCLYTFSALLKLVVTLGVNVDSLMITSFIFAWQLTLALYALYAINNQYNNINLQIIAYYCGMKESLSTLEHCNEKND
jgi:hypothetical protein